MKWKFPNRVALAGGIVLGALSVVLLAFNAAEEKAEARSPHRWHIPETPKSLSFAGEPVPLERRDVREQLERELLINMYGHINTLHILRMATRYFPMIEERLRANGVPDDFKYLCVAESSLLNQVSRAGAVGFWQFMKDTAPRYGLEVNDEVDERYHVLKSTDAACRYLKEAREKFGSWTAAAASYNCGQAGYNNHATFQQTTYYYDLMLPEETMRYMFRIVALKHMITNAEKMGFFVARHERYRPVKTRMVTVTSSVPNLAQFAKENGSNYRMLKLTNPWLRGRSLTVKPGKSYQIEIPEE
jgi:membrane-bound lytic murein transglycosylase D